MQNLIMQLLKTHGVHLGLIGSAVLGYCCRHYWPQAEQWITTQGVDVAVMKMLTEMNTLLKKAGATDDEIKEVTMTVSQVALRFGQDIQKNAQGNIQAPKT